MFSFRTPVSDARSAIDLAQKYVKCGFGARVHLHSEGGATMIIFTEKQSLHELLNCTDKALSAQERADLEHALGDYDVRFNFYLDELAEGGAHKADQYVQEKAERRAFGEAFEGL